MARANSTSNVLSFPQPFSVVPVSKSSQPENKSCWDSFKIPRNPRHLVGCLLHFVEDICVNRDYFYPDSYYSARVVSYHRGACFQGTSDYFILLSNGSFESEKVICQNLRFDPDFYVPFDSKSSKISYALNSPKYRPESVGEVGHHFFASIHSFPVLGHEEEE